MINPRKHPDRHTETISVGKRVAFCRCWQSDMFPYWDGTHRKVKTEADESVGPVVVTVALEEELSKQK